MTQVISLAQIRAAKNVQTPAQATPSTSKTRSAVADMDAIQRQAGMKTR